MEKLLQTDSDHREAVKMLETLTDKWEDGEITTEEKQKIDYLSVLIKTYEEKHYPIGKPKFVAYLYYLIENKTFSFKKILNYLIFQPKKVTGDYTAVKSEEQ